MPSKVARSSQRLLSSAWTKPFALLILAVVPWDVMIRIFSIPAYLIPSPADVAKAFWTEGHKLLVEAVPATLETLGALSLSAPFGIPIGQRS